MGERVTIEKLGRRGDGTADIGGKPVHIAFALAGETVDIEKQGKSWRLASVIEASPDRIEPICRHFGSCGGCQLQHLRHDAYLEFKRSLVTEALQRAQLQTEVGPVLHFEGKAGSGLRRRAVFSFRRVTKGLVLGFAERGSSTIVDLAECPVLSPEIGAALGGLRALCNQIAPQKGLGRLIVTSTSTGLDVAIEMAGGLKAKPRQAAINRAIALDLARLSFNGEVLIETRRPVLQVGEMPVTPPPGDFVQAVAQAQEVMAGLVHGHLAGCKRIADLFSGHGAFALQLAEFAQVLAVEANGEALAALDDAWRKAGGRLRTITHDKRDLFRRPLLAGELKHFDGVVFDPPRAGAEAQANELARSGVRKVAAVSCNPVTLARDLRILIDGGYRLVSVTPVDQFRYSAHIEVVALLER